MNGWRLHWQRTGGPDLLVMLPGAHMTLEHMWDAGLWQAVQQRPQPLDVAWVDPGGSDLPIHGVPAALHTEVLQPARRQYRQVWLGGISLGGQLAVVQAARTPELVDGLCLLAPYPGSRLVANAVARAGGLDHWVPSPSTLQDPDVVLWQWFARPPAGVPVFMGYGAQDRFASGLHTLAQRLPPAAVCTVAGGHDWAAWLPLWQRFLAAGLV